MPNIPSKQSLLQRTLMYYFLRIETSYPKWGYPVETG